MRILIAGGRGFLGSRLARFLRESGHEVRILTRTATLQDGAITWNPESAGAWSAALEETDAVVNASGYGLQHWPWTPARKREFLVSRVSPGAALTQAISNSRRRPQIFIQFSGINRYGLEGTVAADESTPAAEDFMAGLTVQWEEATRPLEELGVRRVVVRNAIVLDREKGLFPLMCLPARLLLGGRLGDGRQAVPWIHIIDHVRAIRFLLENPEAAGAYNLVAPNPSNNAEFMKAVCAALDRPYWFHSPGGLVRLLLGEMADLILRGRPSAPARLTTAGFGFEFPSIEEAAFDLLSNR